MQIVAAVLGDEAAIKLMKEAGGVYLYIPKPDNRPLVIEYLKQNGFNTKHVAILLNISQRKVEKIHREYRNALQAEKAEQTLPRRSTNPQKGATGKNTANPTTCKFRLNFWL